MRAMYSELRLAILSHLKLEWHLPRELQEDDGISIVDQTDVLLGVASLVKAGAQGGPDQ